jgi:hypothetical protein
MSWLASVAVTSTNVRLDACGSEGDNAVDNAVAGKRSVNGERPPVLGIHIRKNVAHVNTQKR